VTTFHRHLVRRRIAASGLAALAADALLILTVFSIEVPASLLYSKLAWPILYGFVPTTLYFILPFALAITWCYGALVRDFAHVILYGPRMSIYSIIGLAVAVASGAAAVSNAKRSIPSGRNVPG
jgi:hypothetical protein